MRRALAPILATVALVSLAGCHVAKPASQTFGISDMSVPDAPEVVINAIATQAAQNGYAVRQEGSRAVFVDFGVRSARVPVPTRYGIWGSRVTFRDTKVASSAFYEAFATGSGSRLRMLNNPIYWHPDIGTWLPGPYDVNPGADLLQGVSGPRYEADEVPVVEAEGYEHVTLEGPVEYAEVDYDYDVEDVVIEIEEAAPVSAPPSAAPSAAPPPPPRPGAMTPAPKLTPTHERLPTPPHLKKK